MHCIHRWQSRAHETLLGPFIFQAWGILWWKAELHCIWFVTYSCSGTLAAQWNLPAASVIEVRWGGHVNSKPLSNPNLYVASVWGDKPVYWPWGWVWGSRINGPLQILVSMNMQKHMDLLKALITVYCVGHLVSFWDSGNVVIFGCRLQWNKVSKKSCSLWLFWSMYSIL